MSAPQPPQETIVVRASLSAYLVFSLLCAMPLGVAVSAPLVGRPWMWEAIAVACAGWVFAIVWLSSFRLEITPAELRYRSLFGGLRTLPRESIERCELRVGVHEPRDRFRPLYRLVVTPRAEARQAPIVINLKVLTMDGLKRAIAALGVEAEPAQG